MYDVEKEEKHKWESIGKNVYLILFSTLWQKSPFFE